jgi:molybdopterin converting factor small subunit
MKAYVKVYATLVKYVSGSIMHEPTEVEVSPKTTLNELYNQLGIPHEEVKTAFVNSVMQTPDYTICEGDEIGIFPPVGGG